MVSMRGSPPRRVLPVHRQHSDLAGRGRGPRGGLAVEIRVDAAHVDCAPGRTGSGRGSVDPGEDHRELAACRARRSRSSPRPVAKVEEDVPSTPRPSSISVCSAREITSRLASSIAFGAYFFRKRSPSPFSRYAPSPRHPSVMRTPVGESVVGWNCIISMSLRGTPSRRAIAIPSPVHEYAFVVP